MTLILIVLSFKGTGGNWWELVYYTYKIQKLKILLNLVFIKKNNKPRFFLVFGKNRFLPVPPNTCLDMPFNILRLQWELVRCDQFPYRFPFQPPPW
jgi:hypothetical protein